MFLNAAHEITSLQLQPRFDLHGAGGQKICAYVADFAYVTRDGVRVVEDVKGMETPVFRLKKKLFEAEYPEFELRLIK